MALKVDHERARTVFDRLVAAYSRREYPFNQPEAALPQAEENLPRGIVLRSRQHALFLFALCYWMRGGVESGTAARQLSRLYEGLPWIFLPESARILDRGLLAACFSEVGLGFNARQIAALWKMNLETLASRWGGDPRNLFKGISTYEEACARIQRKGTNGFGGFQEKMVSMITYFYMDAGIVDPWNFPIPVDFHCLRQVFAHEIVVAERSDATQNGFYTKPVLAAVRALLHGHCVRHGVDPLILCNAVWLYSGLMCNQHPGNISIVPKERNGRSTKIVPVPRWTAAQTRAFDRTCRICVVRDTCHWCVPSAPYYIGGRIELRSMRDEPPQQSLFPLLTDH